MSYEFLQTVALWCTLSLTNGYGGVINACREKALICWAEENEQKRALCVSKVKP